MLDKTKLQNRLNKLTIADVEHAQARWAQGIEEIGKAYRFDSDFKRLAEELVDTLYAFADGEVLFKPTLAADAPFRPTRADALSYFVGGIHAEDEGFATKPWKHVRFGEQQILLNGDTAMAMGHYYFMPYDSNEETKVEFSFGYKADEDGTLRIQLHHSSLPYERH